MNNFMNYIQPTIVKLSDSEGIPTSLHNNYMINLNIVGIKYFQENFIIQENSNGDFIMKESYQEGDPVQCFAWLLEESLTKEDAIDIPRAYIVISADLVEDDSKLKAYTINGLIDNNVFIEGVDGFVPGKDFFINETLYRYLREFNNVEENEDVILTNYFDSLERIAFNGKLKDYLFDKINSIVITEKSEIFKQIQQQLADIKSEFTTESIHKLLNDLAINDNTYLNIYSESVDYLSRNKITDKVINLASEYFKLKASIIITCLLFQKTIDGKKILTNKYINAFYRMRKFNINDYVPNLQLIAPLSKYDRLTYLLTYFNYQNIFMNVTSINNTLNNSSYLNIASGLIAHNNNYSYNVVIPHRLYGTYSFNSKLNPSMQSNSLFSFIPNVSSKKRTTYLNGVINEVDILAFNFKHNISNSLIPLLPDTIKRIYRTWTNITPQQEEYINIIKKYQ